MRRFASISGTGAMLAVLTVGAIGHAQEAANAVPNVVPPARTDNYSVFTEGFYNPQSLAAPGPDGSAGGGAMNNLFRGPRHHRWYFSSDVIYWNRSKTGNKILVYTSPNLFDDLLSVPEGGTTLPAEGAQTTSDGGPLFPTIFDFVQGVARGGTPNDPELRIGVPVNEILIPLQSRMETNDFNYAQRTGFRPTIGIELSSGNRIEFTYSWVTDFRARTLIDNIANTAQGPQFQTFAGPIAAFQRMGYLSSPFTSTDSSLWGETRRATHDPANENPPVPITGSVPREPTSNDVAAGGTNPLRFDALGNPLSFLWQDGELAIANYSFNVQGGELAYRRDIFNYVRGNYKLDLICSVRYVGTDEHFGFFFADTLFDRAVANPAFANLPGLNGPNVAAASQPADETWASITNTIRNDMVGPEIGVNARFPIFAYFEFDVLSKFAGLANWMQKQQTVIRGDGLILQNYIKSSWATTGAFEGHLGLNFKPHANVTFRAGWEWMWLISVATVPGNIAFDLDQLRRPSNNSDALFHGWYGGLEVVF